MTNQPEPPEAQTIRRAREIVDEQAKDEALWALNLDGTLPISEAYLQQELRRLHVAVEAQAAALDVLLSRIPDHGLEPSSEAPPSGSASLSLSTYGSWWPRLCQRKPINCTLPACECPLTTSDCGAVASEEVARPGKERWRTRNLLGSIF